jgi:hypothetical protein
MHLPEEMMARREDRQSLAMNAQCKTPQGRRIVAVSDLSTKGCRLSLASIRLNIGHRVTLRPDDLEGLTGTVRWIADGFAGVEFDYPLHTAVVDHLCRIYRDETKSIDMDFAD